jgi:putative FmdB family regulatory protein
MPRYEYECAECGVRFERVQRFDESPLSTCPECHGEIHRLIKPVGIVFKGSGFYSTDHRTKQKSSTND